VIDVRTQTEQINANLSQEHLFAALTVAFGVLALLLASVGVYGVMAYTVARRTNEIGVRMALGAQTWEVRRMILRESTVLAILGIGIGLLVSLAATRYITSMLYGVTPSDPLTFSGAVLLLLVVALVSGWWPARHASRLEPMVALRHE
jgi:ABC-type antimicrobial peptide transport system permease subunit